jgi:hypothetical protein
MTLSRTLAIMALAAMASATSYDCLFIHGTGQTGWSNATTSFEDYWGKIADYTPQCRTRMFNHFETISLPFDSELLTNAACEFIAGGIGRNATNKMIFTHRCVAGALTNFSLPSRGFPYSRRSCMSAAPARARTA